jgi:hypothetical protein
MAVPHIEGDGESCNKNPPRRRGRGMSETQLSPLNIYINAGATFSFSNLNAGFATPVPFFDYDLIAIAPITTNCRVRFASAGGRAGRSNAVLVAHLVSACGHGKYSRTC